MEKVLNFIKKYSIIIIILVLILIIGLIIIFNDNQEEKLTNTLKDMGIDFYENFYYEKVGETKEERINSLKRYESTGVKVSLDNLSKYNSYINGELLKQFINKKTSNSCDRNASQVIIYPKDPFGKKNYKISIILDCGFDN